MSDDKRISEKRESETPFEMELRSLFQRTAPLTRRVDVGALANPLRIERTRTFSMQVKVGSAIVVAASAIAAIVALQSTSSSMAFADVQQKLKDVQTVKFTITRSIANQPDEVDRVMFSGGDLARAELAN